MANWSGTSRSNYVKFKNPATAVSTLEQVFEIEVHEKGGLFAFLADTFDGNTPDYHIGTDADVDHLFDVGIAGSIDFENDTHVSLLDIIHLFLEPEPDNVFVWITAGAEKARYITGHAIAIDHTGTILDRVSLDDIYDDTNWTRAEY